MKSIQTNERLQGEGIKGRVFTEVQRRWNEYKRMGPARGEDNRLGGYSMNKRLISYQGTSHVHPDLFHDHRILFHDDWNLHHVDDQPFPPTWSSPEEPPGRELRTPS